MANVDDKGNGRTINTRGLGFYEPDALESRLFSRFTSGCAQSKSELTASQGQEIGKAYR